MRSNSLNLNHLDQQQQCGVPVQSHYFLKTLMWPDRSIQIRDKYSTQDNKTSEHKTKLKSFSSRLKIQNKHNFIQM